MQHEYPAEGQGAGQAPGGRIAQSIDGNDIDGVPTREP